jgi:SAM-dependent methyltransferase
MSDVAGGTRTTAGHLRNAEESQVRYRGGAPFGTPESSTEALFQRQWRIYRKVVDNNYLFHREAYARLHHLLINEIAEPFCFLDVACGDASATVDALKGTQVDNYHGIDFSRAALDIAEETLRVVGCQVKLYENDFVRALKDWREPVRVAWIGLSLHHLSTPEKLNVMRDIRHIVDLQGVFAVYENTSPDGEDREQWHRRWDLQKPHWTALTLEEWDAITAHVHAADIPETTTRWHELGHEAGFRNVREVFASPTDLFRMYIFRA